MVRQHYRRQSQGFTFRTHDHAWHPTDHEGVTLIQRPDPGTSDPALKKPPPAGWSAASKRRRLGRS
jgi:CRISPR-associated protein Cas2